MSKESASLPGSSSEPVDDKKAENTVQCVNVLIQSVIKGQKAGAYTLEEASIIMEAIKFLQKNMGSQKES
jgi:hypothetical protein